MTKFNSTTHFFLKKTVLLTIQLIGNSIFTNGGRVINITSFGSSVKEANLSAINAIKMIKWDNSYYRHDIGWRAIKRENNEQ